MWGIDLKLLISKLTLTHSRWIISLSWSLQCKYSYGTPLKELISMHSFIIFVGFYAASPYRPRLSPLSLNWPRFSWHSAWENVPLNSDKTARWWKVGMNTMSDISCFTKMLHSLSLGLSVVLGRRKTPPAWVWMYRWSGPAMLVPWGLELWWARNL